MDSGRELFNRFRRGQTMSRPAFVPLIRGLVAKVGGVAAQPMHADPTLWANSLDKTANLLNLDGVVVGFDMTLLAEGCGCRVEWVDDRPVVHPPPGPLNQAPDETGRMKHALEAARRVFQVCQQSRACVAALTGPATLATQLFGPEQAVTRLAEVKPLILKATEAFCQMRPDVIIFLEGRALAQEGPTPAQRRLYNTLKNVAGYYDVLSGLYLKNYPPADVPRFAALNLDIYVLGPPADGGLPPLEGLWELSQGAVGVGIGLPTDDLPTAREVIRMGLDLYAKRGRQGLFFTSLGSLTREARLETLRQLIAEINQVRLQGVG